MERAIKEQNHNEAAEPSHAFQGHAIRTPALTAIAASIDNSPRMVAQRRKLQSLFGGVAQLQEREEETVQGMFAPVQRAEADEEEPLQGKFAAVQRVEEEGPLQARAAPVQREGDSEEEEPLQGKFEPLQRQADTEEELPVQGKFSSAPVQRESEPQKPNNTGLPDNLKNGIESLSGMSMDNVKVHYNSSQPAQLNALAYAQGTDIHVAPGQEKHLPHEAWHVVQQAQGRVKPTMQMKQGVPVNDDKSLEHEADVMGGKAVQMPEGDGGSGESDFHIQGVAPNSTIQRNSEIGFVDNRNKLRKTHTEFGNIKPAVQLITTAVNTSVKSSGVIQKYSYEAVPTDITVKISKGVTQKWIESTGAKVTWNQGETMDPSSKGSREVNNHGWVGLLKNQNNGNNATGLHVVNANWGGSANALEGNLVPGTPSLNSHHKSIENQVHTQFGYSGPCRPAFRFDGDRHSGGKPTAVPVMPTG
jgi:hypothetical protein